MMLMLVAKFDLSTRHNTGLVIMRPMKVAIEQRASTRQAGTLRSLCSMLACLTRERRGGEEGARKKLQGLIRLSFDHHVPIGEAFYISFIVALSFCSCLHTLCCRCLFVFFPCRWYWKINIRHTKMRFGFMAEEQRRHIIPYGAYTSS